MADPVTEAERIVRSRAQRRMRWLMPLAFVAALGAGAAVTSDTGTGQTTVAAQCAKGQHPTFSKYTGTTCQGNADAATKGVATVVGGCFVGLFGMTPISILGGCGAGAVGLVVGSL